MKAAECKTPLAFKIALSNLVVGCVGLSSAVFFTSPAAGLGHVSIGLILLGTGEYMNNPRVKVPPFGVDKISGRRRNTCALGNLLGISGVLMIAIGVGEFLL